MAITLFSAAFQSLVARVRSLFGPREGMPQQMALATVRVLPRPARRPLRVVHSAQGRMVISADPDAHRAEIQRYVDLGFDRIYLHNVGRNQREWIEVFGRDVIPALHR